MCWCTTVWNCVHSHMNVCLHLRCLKCRRRCLTFPFCTPSSFFPLNFPSSSNTFLGLTQLAAFWLQLGKFTIIPLKMKTQHFLICNWGLTPASLLGCCNTDSQLNREFNAAATHLISTNPAPKSLVCNPTRAEISSQDCSFLSSNKSKCEL